MVKVFKHLRNSSILNILRHIQVYMVIFRKVSGISITLCNPGIFKTLVNLEPEHILNRGHIQNSAKYLRWGALQK